MPNPTPFALLLQLQRNPRPFTRAQVQQLPRDRQGVYAIWEPPEYGESTDTCAYVGMSTTCITTRLLDHISDETNPELRNHSRLPRPPNLHRSIHHRRHPNPRPRTPRHQHLEPPTNRR